MTGSNATHPNNNTSHHYAIDAAKLVEECRSLLRSILDVVGNDRRRRRSFQQLATLADALKCVDRLVHAHLLELLDREMEFLTSSNNNNGDDVLERERLHRLFFGEHAYADNAFPTLTDTARTLRCAAGVAGELRGGRSGRGDGGDRGRGSANNADIGGGGRRSPLPSSEDPGEWYHGNDAAAAARRSPSPPPPPPPHSSSSSSPLSPPRSPFRFAPPPGSPPPPPPLLTTSMTTTLPSSPTKRCRSRDAYRPSRSAKDSGLFRLIVTLQLCLVRIEEADAVLCEGRAAGERQRSRSEEEEEKEDAAVGATEEEGMRSSTGEKGGSTRQRTSEEETGTATNDGSRRRARTMTVAAVASVAVVGGVALLLTSSVPSERRGASTRRDHREPFEVLGAAGKAAAGAAIASLLRKRWRALCTNARVANSADAIEDWIFHWICLGGNGDDDGGVGYGRPLAPRKSAFWYSVGPIRFQLMKRGMDLLYASIGKAIEVVEEDPSKSSLSSSSSSLWTYVVASLASGYYNVVGPAAKSASSLANAPSSVIRNAWGVVSLPAVKRASLEATRILKGAAIADRIEICGVSCFVLSREPFPALASALRRYRRQQERGDVRLGTIHETLPSYSSHPSSSANARGFQRRNLVLHLTGGGFFAHTIAADLPFLLDWSASSGAVVIIPEYALFPHRFPDALAEMERIYRGLRCGEQATLLGFQPDRIIVSGESVGGNLAAALCVSMISDHEHGGCVELTSRQSAEMFNDVDDVSFYGEDEDTITRAIRADEFGSESRYTGLELPDALMLCCPALNLSLDPTPSRIDGADDPVLPSALITTISNSYLGGRTPATNPVASPYFASDAVLRGFPPTLIFASSRDPFLDDSVAFNGRLRNVGVRSSLRAVHDLPHAYWALATAGIPEARQVQRECQQWLAENFA